MHLRYVLLMAMTTLAATSSIVSAASIADDVKMFSADQAYPTKSVHEDYESKRYLRTGTFDKNNAEETGPVFLEHKLEKALTNPKKSKRLYQTWYTRGLTPREVSLSLGENRELNKTYKKLAAGYTAYIKEKGVSHVHTA